jgi:subtilisin family serine protease
MRHTPAKAVLVAILVLGSGTVAEQAKAQTGPDPIDVLAQELWSEQRGGDMVVVTEVAGVPTFTVVEDVDTVTEAATGIETAVRAKGRRAVLGGADWQEEATLTNVTGPLPQWPVTALGLSSAWASSTGTGVTVAVVDSGVAAHPDIPNLLPGFSSVGGSITAGQTDTYGHGTHVAGIIASGADGIGTTGVAHNARILPIRAFVGTSAPVADVAAGIVKAVQEGAQVINMSFGFASENVALTAAIDYAVANNVVLVAATGNEALSVRWPAADDHVIAVGATTEDGNLSWRSNTGPQVDLVAPGRNVYSTVVANQYFPGVGGVTDGSYSYSPASGTSMASPHVAGVAALLLARHPGATRDQVAEFLTSSATDKGTTGFDTSYGWGLVSPVGALAAADSALGAPAGAAPTTVPGAPEDLTATTGDGEISLSWSPAADNGAAITDYRIEYVINTGAPWTIVNDGVDTDTSVTVTQLVNGTNYSFRVTAWNGVGWGSSATAAATPAGAPGAPEDLSATTGDGEISLSWSPAADNGSVVVGYEIEYSGPETGNDWVTWEELDATVTSLTVSGLSNGSDYQFRVTAWNGVGWGSSATAAATPAGAPGAPEDLTATVADHAIELNWNASSSNGSDVTFYALQVSVDHGRNWLNFGAVASTTVTVTGLANGTNYTFRVTAQNGIGWGISATTAATPAGVPGAPLNPVATAGDGVVRIVWSAPSANGSAVTDYRVEYSVDGGATWATANDGEGTNTTVTVTGLANGTNYTFRVTAQNGIGWGISATTAATPAGVPSDQNDADGTAVPNEPVREQPAPAQPVPAQPTPPQPAQISGDLSLRVLGEDIVASIASSTGATMFELQYQGTVVAAGTGKSFVHRGGATISGERVYQLIPYNQAGVAGTPVNAQIRVFAPTTPKITRLLKSGRQLRISTWVTTGRNTLVIFKNGKEIKRIAVDGGQKGKTFTLTLAYGRGVYQARLIGTYGVSPISAGRRI